MIFWDDKYVIVKFWRDESIVRYTKFEDGVDASFDNCSTVEFL